MLKQSLPGSALTLWILFISLQIAGLPMLGLAPDKPVHQYIVDKWEVKEGLPSNSVQAISQTPDGYLWLATSGGLVRFDGITFRVIPFLESSKDKSLQSTAPGYLYLDRENILWIGSERGLTSYDYQTHRFKTYTKADGLADNHIRFITGDMNNNLWISFFPGGVTRFSKIDHTFITYGKEEGLSEEKINAIIEDRYGDMFLGTIGKGILTYSQGKFSQYDVAGLEDAHVIPMFKDSKECLWIGTTKGLFSAVNGDVKAYTSTTGLLGDHITDIHEDKNRNLWIGTTKGLTRIRKQHTAPIFENILESSKIICLFEDRENNLWVGTDHSGLKRIKDRTFFPYPPLQAHKDEILLSIYQGKGGDVWTGTLDKKLYHSSKNMKTRLVEHSELSDVAIAAIARDKNGDLWLGTNGKGVFQRKAGTLRRYGTRDGLAGDTVTSIYEDSRSNLWFSTLKGLSVYLYEKKIIKTL
ncbi:MAG: hypothetical protein GY757_41775, partial [bacterium]|nr:hypothetical protein [bacterium]